MSKGEQPTTDVRSFIRNYALGLTLLLLFLASWIGQFIVQMIEFRAEAESHGESFSFIDYLPAFGASTLENWQSEFLQLLTFVVLTSFLIHKGSPESRDGDHEMKMRLEKIQSELQALREAHREPAGSR